MASEAMSASNESLKSTALFFAQLQPLSQLCTFEGNILSPIFNIRKVGEDGYHGTVFPSKKCKFYGIS